MIIIIVMSPREMMQNVQYTEEYTVSNSNKLEERSEYYKTTVIYRKTSC